MSDDMDDLFGDDDDEQQQEHGDNVLQDEDAAAAQQAEEEVDYGAGLEDDMGDEPAAAADAGGRGGGGLDADEERELFGGLDEEGEDDAGPGPQEERGPPIDVHAPLLPRPGGDRVMLLRVPNILRIEPRPYDPNTFEEGVEEIVDERTGVVRTRPRDINVIRWRFKPGEDGQVTRESNARFVKWSDGSESIVLGDEVLNVDRQQTAKAHTYLYAVRYDVIEGQAHLNTRVTVAPASLNSKLHKRLKMTVQQATKKVDKVQMHYAVKNPELEKAEIEKRAEEQARLKAARERAAVRPSMPKRRPVFTAAYLEDEEDYGAGGAADYGYEEEEAGGAAADDDELHRRRLIDQEEEEAAARRLRVAKRTTPPLAGGGSRKRGYEEESEDEAAAEEAPADAAGKAAPGIKVRRGAILDDDDD